MTLVTLMELGQYTEKLVASTTSLSTVLTEGLLAVITQFQSLTSIATHVMAEGTFWTAALARLHFALHTLVHTTLTAEKLAFGAEAAAVDAGYACAESTIPDCALTTCAEDLSACAAVVAEIFEAGKAIDLVASLACSRARFVAIIASPLSLAAEGLGAVAAQ